QFYGKWVKKPRKTYLVGAGLLAMASLIGGASLKGPIASKLAPTKVEAALKSCSVRTNAIASKPAPTQGIGVHRQNRARTKNPEKQKAGPGGPAFFPSTYKLGKANCEAS
ncbi:hypothetical protein, partial [Pseudomonas gingeri]|uniref:hypothetical protein n=1 Tax=Pseudomonas gingeri TaxID=117681 RepID=UPI001C433157